MLGKLRFRARLMMFAAVILVNGVVAAQDGFFFDVGADYLSRNIAGGENFALPALLGGHAAFGYSLKRLDLSAEGGAAVSGEGSHPDFSGVMPEVSGYQFPLSLRGSVNVLPSSAFQLRPELSAGATWTSQTLWVRNFAYKETISDWMFVAGGGLRLSVGFASGLAALYAGAYIDYRFDINDFSNVDKQSANFQIRGGVMIHPRGSGGSSAGRSKSKASGGTTRTTTRSGDIKTYTAPSPTELPNGSMDGLLLNVLRGDQIQTGSTVDAARLLSVLRQENSPYEPGMTDQPYLAQTPDSQTASQTPSTPAATPRTQAPTTTPAPQTATTPQAPAATPQTATTPQASTATTTPQTATTPQAPATTPQTAATPQTPTATSAPQTATTPQSPAVTPAPRATPATQPRTAAAPDPAIAKDLERQRQEITAMRAEIEKQKAALAAENTSVVRTTTITTMPENNKDTIYYGPEETRQPVIYSVPTLDAIGRRLKENDELMVTVRGYSAPAGTVASQLDVSEKRAKYCADYLIERFSIPKDRIVVEWYGASRKPETAAGHEGLTLDRAVELILSVKTTQVITKN